MKPHKVTQSLVGVYIPRPWAQYLILYSLAKGQTKSRVARCVFQNWVQKAGEREPDFVLMGEIVRGSQLRWDQRKALLRSDKKRSGFDSFLAAEKKRLVMKKVEIQIINEILSKITI